MIVLVNLLIEPMKNILLLFSIAIAILSMFRHLTFNSTIFEIVIILLINIAMLYFNVVYIQSIGLDISFYIINFILLINIILILFRIIYFNINNKFIKIGIKYIVNFIVKQIILQPITFLSQLSFFMNRLFNYLKINFNKGLILYDEIEPLKLISIKYDKKSKFHNIDFENSQLYTKDILMSAL
jgi:hypothetical protein